MSTKSSSDISNRREFVKQSTLAAAAVPLFIARGSTAQANQTPADEKATKDEPQPAAEADRDAAELTQPELILEVIKQRYPDVHLTPEVQRNILRDLHGDQYRSRILSNYPLKNGDEPGSVFSAFRQFEG